MLCLRSRYKTVREQHTYILFKTATKLFEPLTAVVLVVWVILELFLFQFYFTFYTFTLLRNCNNKQKHLCYEHRTNTRVVSACQKWLDISPWLGMLRYESSVWHKPTKLYGKTLGIKSVYKTSLTKLNTNILGNLHTILIILFGSFLFSVTGWNLSQGVCLQKKKKYLLPVLK